MGDTYIQEMANHKRQLLEDKLLNINEDNIKLRQIQKEGEEERYRQTLSRVQLKRDRDYMLKAKEEQRIYEGSLKDQEKNNYNMMVQQNIDKEISKEMEYKGYFKEYENKHKSRVKNHENYLRNSYNRRDGESELYEKKYIEEKQAIGDMIFKNTIDKQNDITKKNYDIVKQQLEKKQMDRLKEAEMQRKAIEQRFKEEEYNQKLNRLEKEENAKSKMMYSDFLKRQVDIKKSNNYGTMTDNEYKFNRPDIPEQTNHRSVQSLIPGINHLDSIGSKPTWRKGINFSPVKENLKIDQSLVDKIKVVRSNESRSSVRRNTSRNTLQ